MTEFYNLIDQSGNSHVESDGRVVSEYVEAYRFGTNSGSRPTFAAILAAMSMSPGSPYFVDTNATLRSADVKSEQTIVPKLKYIVTVKWSTNASVPADTSTDPTTRRTIWGIKPTVQQRFIIRDRSNDLIVNTAGQPFDGGTPVDVRLGVVTATRNVVAAGYDSDAVLANCGKLNSVTFLGAPAGTVQVDIETHEKFEGAYHFWEESYTFTYDPLGHQPKPASVGFYEKNGLALRRIQIDNKDVLEPEPLTSAGVFAPIAGRPANCAFITVIYFDDMDFATFGL